MKITVASGKGGTGKTTVATSLVKSLSSVAPQRSPETQKAGDKNRIIESLVFLDGDVEVPNAHLYLKPSIQDKKDVNLLIPSVDHNKCTLCGKCAEVCRYGAIGLAKTLVLVFPQLCHGCGSCTLMCPEGAISEIENPIGHLEKGITASGIPFSQGLLKIGEPMAVPIIRALKRWQHDVVGDPVLILDAPPGISCPVVEVMRDADFVLLVTEPTPFGLHDLELALDVTTELEKPSGVVINRNGIADETEIVNLCDARNIPVLMRIPFDQKIAEGTARGKTLVEIDEKYIELFLDLFYAILKISGHTND